MRMRRWCGTCGAGRETLIRNRMEDVASVFASRLLRAFEDFERCAGGWLHEEYMAALCGYMLVSEPGGYVADKAEALRACKAAVRALIMHELRFRRGMVPVDLARAEARVDNLRARISAGDKTVDAHYDLDLAQTCLQALNDHADYVLDLPPPLP